MTAVSGFGNLPNCIKPNVIKIEPVVNRIIRPARLSNVIELNNAPPPITRTTPLMMKNRDAPIAIVIAVRRLARTEVCPLDLLKRPIRAIMSEKEQGEKNEANPAAIDNINKLSPLVSVNEKRGYSIYVP